MKTIKYSGINLKMTRRSMFMDWQNYIVKITTLPKKFHGFNAIGIKIPMMIFIEL
jgi:hypothetical protein